MFIATTEGSLEAAWMAEAEAVGFRKISVIRDAFPKADADKTKSEPTGADFRRLSDDKTSSVIAAGLPCMAFVLQEHEPIIEEALLINHIPGNITASLLGSRA